MRSLEDREVSMWMEKAKRDLRMAQLAARDEHPMWDQACFHAQQAGEKTLKAALVACESNVPRTHDIIVLADQLLDLLPLLNDHMESLAMLNQFGVAPRYPSWLADETQDEAEAAIETALLIMKLVTEALE
jgi:HEPN domain-containing protein